MKRIQQSLLGVSAFLSVPATIEEFNTLAKGEKVLDYANAEAYYRGVAPKVRALFLELVEKELGIEQKVISEETVGEGDSAKVVKTYEKDTAFLKRVKASGITDDQLQPLLQRAFDEIGWDLTSSRSTGANKAEELAIPIVEEAEKLVGFAAHSSAIAVAMRYLQPVADYQQAGAVTDPTTGMTFGYLSFTDTRSNKIFITPECL